MPPSNAIMATVLPSYINNVQHHETKVDEEEKKKKKKMKKKKKKKKKREKIQQTLFAHTLSSGYAKDLNLYRLRGWVGID